MWTGAERGFGEARGGLAIEHLVRTGRLAALLACTAVATPGCGNDDPGVARSTASGSPRSSASGSGAVSHGGPGASQSAAPPGSGAPPTGGSPFAGTWKGSYRAEKVIPTLDPTVKDEVWKGDDGQRQSGTGRMELTVATDGTTSGTIDGPLGTSDIRGVSDETMVRATIVPTADDGASGTLIGKAVDKGLAVEVRTSDGAGKTPRIARATLERAR